MKETLKRLKERLLAGDPEGIKLRTHSSLQGEMKKIFFAGIAALFICCISFYLCRNRLTVYFEAVEVNTDKYSVSVTSSSPGVATLKEVNVTGGLVSVTIIKTGEGETELSVTMPGTRNIIQVCTNKLGLLTESHSGNFSGWPVMIICGEMFFLYSSYVFIKSYLSERKKNLFSYTTISRLSFGIFFGVLAAMGLMLVSIMGVDPSAFTFDTALRLATNAALYFSIASVPFILSFAGALCISNIRLIQKEGKCFVNLLGIILSLCIVVGAIGGIILAWLVGVNWPRFLQNAVINSYYGVYAYFVCIIFSVFLIFVHINRSVPDMNLDYIIILGCAIRDDGTLYPLIRGRVDKALEFARMQEEKTGKKLIFIPSGGQGDDEIISEGQAMANYILSKGVPEERVHPEMKSVNTYENMMFSQKIANEFCPGGKGAFSTTNYHVFRSGIMARKCGLNIDGMGSKTKWYFWPNALVREFIGLIVDDIVGILQFVFLIVAASVLLSYIGL